MKCRVDAGVVRSRVFSPIQAGDMAPYNGRFNPIHPKGVCNVNFTFFIDDHGTRVQSFRVSTE